MLKGPLSLMSTTSAVNAPRLLVPVGGNENKHHARRTAIPRPLCFSHEVSTYMDIGSALFMAVYAVSA